MLKIFPQIEYFNIAIFESSHLSEVFNSINKDPIFRITPKTPRLTLNSINLYADPFLFTHEDTLYLFVEQKSDISNGKIVVYKTTDLIHWENLGIVLDLPFHASFPFIFQEGEHIYMIPETAMGNSIDLYEAQKFPFGWKKVKSIIPIKSLDTHILKYNGIYFLFTNTRIGLRLFYSDSILSNWTEHKKSPVISDTKIERSAGSIIQIGEKLFRPAQDCSGIYGDNFGIYEITCLTTDEYKETLHIEKMINHNAKWKENGGHHISIARFKDKYIVAADGKFKSNFIDSITYYPFRIIEKIFYKV